jgi:hypothetical protein
MNTCQNGTIEPYLKLSNSSSYLFFSPFTVIVQLVSAETKDFLTDSDLQGRVESGNDPPPRTSLILNRAQSAIADMMAMLRTTLSSDPQDVEGAVAVVNEIIKAARNTLGISSSAILKRLSTEEQTAYRKALNTQSQLEA